jgi:2-hydroxy-3-oxopropionate reductase
MAAYALDGDPNQLAFSIRNACKDVGYYERMTQDAGAPSIMAGSALSVLKEATDTGSGDAMVPELLDYYLKQLKGD